MFTKEEQIKLVQELFKMEGEYELRITVWYPTKKKLDWILEQNIHIEIHSNCNDILTLTDTNDQYSSPTTLVVYLREEDVDEFREHPKLKDLYNEWYFNKQKEENKRKKGGEQINERRVSKTRT